MNDGIVIAGGGLAAQRAAEAPRRLGVRRPADRRRRLRRVIEVDEVARVIGTGPDELLLAAAEVCPTTAIRIVDQQTGEQVYP